MSAASCLLNEDQFLCSICLDVFTDPVTIPCGHNFCKTCITKHWDINVPCRCPNCQKVFNTRPELQVNTFISEMAAQFRQSAQQKASSSSSEQQAAKPGEVKAWMVYLLCLMCVCILCMILNHKTHVVGKKAELGKTEAEIQQMIQKRRLKIQEIKHSVELSKEDADREIADGVQVFTTLKESSERSQAELIDTIKEKQRKTEKQAEGFIKELEQEISKLKKRSTEVEQLSRSEDHLHLLQSFTSLNAAPPTKDWTQVNVRPPFYEGTVRRAVNQLEEILKEEIMYLVFAEHKRVQRSAVDLTLDLDTAHTGLILSDDGKEVKLGHVWKYHPDSPKRFDSGFNVLAKESFSSGRFYYEVQVKGNTAWSLGVVRESINRKAKITVTPQNGYWTISLIYNNRYYTAAADPAVRLSLKSEPEKVGVLVDYEEGLVSFYDVDTAALIYSFTGCSFTEKLYPLFSPSLNYDGAALIISPVNHTE
ncbi:nuclear factor 7, ovary-like [Sebastes fasciatus]|uniref:nuclear factor 7, ovary-like n=1 Tax=Sebastes fasciatus TaxID=394691 RepID=UPI003D9F4E94